MHRLPLEHQAGREKIFLMSHYSQNTEQTEGRNHEKSQERNTTSHMKIVPSE